LSLIELLVAGFVVTIVLGLGAAFLSQQMALQRSVQARNDVQDRVRVVMQVVTQDLSLAGNSFLVSPDGSVLTERPGLCRNVSAPNVNLPCVTLLDDELDAHRSELSVRYLSSQFPAGQECRDVSYRVVEDVLMRSDVACEADEDLVAFAPGVLAFEVRLICSDGTVVALFDSVGDCGVSGFPRTAVVTFGAQSDIRVRSPASTLSLDGGTIDCEQGSVCFLLTHEVLLPNLKDQ
jgi:type II secretory pathway component PulJ